MREPSRLVPILVALGLAGCASARQLDPDEPVSRGPNEGLVALVVEGARVESMTLCGPDWSPPCFRAGPFNAERPVRIALAPAGEYCMTRVVFTESTASANIYEPEEPRPCVRLRGGALAYPGHLTAAVSGTHTIASRLGLGVRTDRADLERLLERDYPNVAEAGLPTDLAPWRWPDGG